MRGTRHLAVFASLVASVPTAFAWGSQDETPAPNPPAATTEAEAPVATVPVDGRRTSRRFVSNLGRNVVGMFSRDNLVPFAIGAGATTLAIPFDDNVQRYFGEGERKAKWLGDFAQQLGNPFVLTPIAAVLYGAGRLAPNHQRFRDASYDIGQVFLVGAVYTTTIKFATQRPRPNRADKLSFPSGHTSNAFAWATVANHYYGPKVGIPSFAFATLIGVGRMENRVHHLTDVLGGATLGYLVGRTVTRRDSEPLPGTHARQFRISPQAGPRGEGVGLTASLQF